jgi:hypothetical protein
MRNDRRVRGVFTLDELLKNEHMLKVAYLIEKGAPYLNSDARGLGQKLYMRNNSDSFNMHM